MNEGRKRNELPVQNTENRGGKNIYYLLLISYPLFCCWAEFIFRLRLKHAEKHTSHIGERATRLGLVHSHNGEHALRLDEEAGATETDTTSIYEYGSRTFMKKKYGAKKLFLFYRCKFHIDLSIFVTEYFSSNAFRFFL